jgi:hypothetical protein
MRISDGTEIECVRGDDGIWLDRKSPKRPWMNVGFLTFAEAAELCAEIKAVATGARYRHPKMIKERKHAEP